MPNQLSRTFSAIKVEFVLFSLTATGVIFAVRKGGVSANNEHLWWQNGTQVFISFMRAFSDRYSVYQDQERQKENEIAAQMQALYSAGQQAMKQGEYRVAADCFKRSATMFKSYYKGTAQELLTDLYAQSIYYQACSLFQLREYQNARILMESLFQQKITLEATVIKVQLHNLLGLLYFIQYQVDLFEQETPTHTLLEKAKEQLKHSYNLNSEQDDVYLMNHYLHGNMALVVKRQPFQILASLQSADARLPLLLKPDSLFYPFIYFVVADAYADQKKWMEAIYLYEQYLAHVPSGTGSNAIFDQFIARLYCLSAYRQYITMCYADDAKYDLLDNVAVASAPLSQTEGAGELKLVKNQLSKEEIKKRATLMALRAKYFLEDGVPGEGLQGYVRAYDSLAREANHVITFKSDEQFVVPTQPVSRPAASLWSGRFFAAQPDVKWGQTRFEFKPI